MSFLSLSQENRVAAIDPPSRKVSVGTVPIQTYATPNNRLLLVAK